jgi:hypothetical protein
MDGGLEFGRGSGLVSGRGLGEMFGDSCAAGSTLLPFETFHGYSFDSLGPFIKAGDLGVPDRTSSPLRPLGDIVLPFTLCSARNGDCNRVLVSFVDSRAASTFVNGEIDRGDCVGEPLETGTSSIVLDCLYRNHTYIVGPKGKNGGSVQQN